MSIISGGGAVVGAGGAAGGYEIERSLRFNSADSANLSRTPSTTGNQKVWTWSAWVKKPSLGGTQYMMSAPNYPSLNDGIAAVYFENDQLHTYYDTSGLNPYGPVGPRLYRDPSAWYHIVWAVDAINTVHYVYVNNVLVSTDTSKYPPNYSYTMNLSGYDHRMGTQAWGPSTYANLYMTEVHFVDGQVLTPTDFGEFNSTTGVWQPIEYTGTYGTNGFYLNFSDNSGTTSTTLGKDYSGNGNNWTPNNFSVTAGAGNDSLVDTPTNYGTDTGAGGEVRGNYCTLNAVKPVTNSITFSNGNLQYKPGSSWSTTTYVEGTLGVLGGSTGKYYWEMSADQTGAFWTAGVALQNNTIGGSNIGTTGSVMIYDNAKYVNGTSTSSYLTSLSANEVLGIALDAATGKVWFRDSGGFLGSGDPAAGTNETGIPTGFSGATLVPVTQANSASTVTANFGQRPFAYTAPSGFKALCTQNLLSPTIIQGDDYFNTILYTGTGSSNARTGVGFQPDFVWIKGRSGATDHGLYDAVRGVQKQLESNTTTAETTETTGLTAFGSDGFTVGALAQLNTSSATYVAWNWKANGAGVSNTAGTISSTVSVNTTSGFSIVTYSGNSVAGATVGHGLGVTPSMIIVKSRTASAGYLNWGVYHVSLGATKVIYLNTTGAESVGIGPWNDTAPTSTVFSLGNDGGFGFGISGQNYVAYCFAPVAGYSAFGSYTGNGSSDGSFVYTGFRPRFVMVKRSSGSGEPWQINDTARNPSNLANLALHPNYSDAEATYGSAVMDILSNGFKLRGNDIYTNGSGSTYIYMAFAENPFKYSLAR